MKILGISAYYHDSAAVLLDKEEIVAAAREERFTRKKHDAGFSINSVRYCLEEGIDRGCDANSYTRLGYGATFCQSLSGKSGKI